MLVALSTLQTFRILVAGYALVVAGNWERWESRHARAIIQRLHPDSDSHRTQHINRKLKSLNLSYLRFRSETTAHVARLKHLEYLHLNGSSIDDVGLRGLKGLDNLEYINLDNTLVSVEGVRQLLRDLPGLREVSLCGSLLTAEDIASLKDGRRVHIIWSTETRSNIQLIQRWCHLTTWTVLIYRDDDGRANRYVFVVSEDVEPSEDATAAFVELSSGIDVELDLSKWTPSQWDFLGKCGRRLRSIEVDQVAPGAIDVVTKARHLISLSLGSTFAETYDVSGLVALRELRHLDVEGASNVDRVLADGSEHLLVLWIESSDVTVEGLASLKRQKDLVELKLRSNKLRDEDMQALPVLPRLEFLGLDNNPRLTDAIDPILQKQPKLDVVSGFGTALSEAVLKEFAPDIPQP